MRRLGFTLMELLVVVGVILVLAGMTFSAVSIIKRQARETQCRNNLQQLAIGITAYQQDAGNRFPETFGTLLAPGRPLAGESTRLLLCPFDARKGADPGMGRPAAWGGLSELYQPGCSYLFEAADVVLGATARTWQFDDGAIWSDNGRTTWADAKAYQLKHGNTSGSPFRPQDFPIVRCFWHGAWKSDYNASQERKVLNLAWDMSLFWSLPKWEDQVRAP